MEPPPREQSASLSLSVRRRPRCAQAAKQEPGLRAPGGRTAGEAPVPHVGHTRSPQALLTQLAPSLGGHPSSMTRLQKFPNVPKS